MDMKQQLQELLDNYRREQAARRNSRKKPSDCLDDHDMAKPKSERPQCNTRTRSGKPCQARVAPGKQRCRMHGGLSTGPKSQEGRERIAEAQRQRWTNWRDKL